MRGRALFCLIGSLILIAKTAGAVAPGSSKTCPDTCCDIADGHRTIYDVRAGAYWVPIDGVWWAVPDDAVVRDAGNPLGEAVVWYVSVRGNITIRCFVPADAS